MAEFRLPRILSERDVVELLTQAVEEMSSIYHDTLGKVNPGASVYNPPYLGLLVNNELMLHQQLTEKGRIITHAYLVLCYQLEALVAEHLTTVMARDNFSFNYSFRSLRGDCIHFKHNTPNEGIY